jgi:hypothetical protein
VTAESQPSPVRRRLPRAALIAIIAGGAVLALIVVGVVSLAVALGAFLSLGPTAATDLRPGACLAEPDADLAQYTVVDCVEEPAQQVVAEIDLGRDTEQYTTPAALDAFAQEICDRFLEYALYVPEDIDIVRFDLAAITVPTPDEVAAGDTVARCAVVARDGSPLPGSLFRAMP